MELSNLPPISMPTPASSRADPTPATNAMFTVAGHKVTTHSLAVAAGILLTLVGPYVAQMWPQAAPVIDIARKALPAPDPTSPAPTVSPYELQVRIAWANEKEGSDALKKAEKLRRLIFLYRRAAWESENKWADLAELYKSFHDSAEKLGMTSKLPVLRGVISAEWTGQIPEKAPGPITEPTRVKMSCFLRETIRVLDRLP